MKTDDRVAVAAIIKPHGIHGQVKVRLLTNFEDRLTELKKVILLADKDREINAIIQSVSGNIVKLDVINSIEQAQGARGWLLAIEQKDVKRLPVGHYYHFEIVGLKVFSEADEYLGEVTEVISTGSNDVYLVKDGLKEILVPALKKAVKIIDIKNGRMEVFLKSGFLNL